MKYSIYNENDWLFLDSEHSQDTDVAIDMARNGHSGFCVLGETGVKYCVANTNVIWKFGKGPIINFYEMKSVGVDENTSDTLMTTTDYEKCKDFVTRKAPFRVYDALSPLSYFKEDRFAVFCEIYAPPSLAPGVYEGEVSLFVKGYAMFIPIKCTLHKATVPYLKRSKLSMLNFCSFENIASQHNVKIGGKVYYQLYRKYVKMMLKLRLTHITLPTGVAIYDENKKLVGFDFSLAQALGKIAIEEGAPHLNGGNFAHWNKWDEAEYYPFWDPKLSLSTPEGYLQLKLYFTEWGRIINKNGWEKVMTQSLADEPQVHNDITYCVLAAACRKFLPGVKIIEAVETTNLGAGLDIWVPKQDTFEKHREEFERLKDLGEEMWFYTCAFPAGRMMNRSMDLPLAVSREILWMGYGYGLSGFLHWGFNYYTGDDIWNKACCPHKGELLPAGDAHIVYPEHLSKNTDDVLMSMRLHAQRCGAEDFELFKKLEEYAPDKAIEIQRLGCTSFSDYEKDGKKLSQAQAKLLEALDQYL